MKNNDVLRAIWLGRGGQGAVTASNLLVSAFVLEGMKGFSMPEFGVERRGAPVKAYSIITKNKDKELPREPIREADVVIIMEKSLLEKFFGIVNVHSETKFIVNASETTIFQSSSMLANHEVWAINATQIALDIFGRPLVNMVLLGSFSKVIGAPTLNSLYLAVKEEFGDKNFQTNVKAIKRGYDEVRKVMLVPTREEAVIHEIA